MKLEMIIGLEPWT